MTLSDLMRQGKIFIYPTDTIYGIGCDATSEESVQKIHRIKQRGEKLFSVIPPSTQWIREHIDIDPSKLAWGPYTYFVFPKNQQCVAPSVRPGKGVDGECSLGLRMPNHWFVEHIRQANVPFVSTSVNLSGMPSMTSLEDLDPAIRDAVDLIIYEGPRTGATSTKVDLTGNHREMPREDEATKTYLAYKDKHF